ncbi:MAG: type I restriction-modification system subunit M [Sediminibacterium sp.]|nr:type I restriction-modification system subunit M [Sediminibacterium sp.]
MAIKKSELYSSIWASCDELRGGMDASQYKDYVLFMLFIKYVSDKYANSDDFAPPVTIPKGSSFKDMLELRGKDDIGDKINTQVIQKLIDANSRLSRSDFPDFNDPNKLGEGKAMVDRLTNLINIFNSQTLDFSKNRADHDDILGDAYEYLMQHFAQESGKSKGQFYTPSEVSRILAKVIGINPQNSVAATTAYDPTCGSGSLLLKVANEAGKLITLEGQEMDVTTSGLARMNMILHDFPTATIMAGNTLASPKFEDGTNLRTYDYVVANPPFSDKTWSTGLTPSADTYKRFEWGEPPAKQGDYAYLMHIIRSMKSTGKAACILPHGVLFRGNAEAVIREQLIISGVLKGVIGLPANLFYGTGIPACILVLDKENATARKGIFMIDASKGFLKDGNKNRLREQDIHKIVDTFTKQQPSDKFSRMVPLDEIADPKNDYNLNIPRYIDSTEQVDIQDIDAHLNGGIPMIDVDAMQNFWTVLPSLRNALFEPSHRNGYLNAKLSSLEIKPAIHQNTEFHVLQKVNTAIYENWKRKLLPELKGFDIDAKPKLLIDSLSESLLNEFKTAKLLNPYDVYQHLMNYWNETMQDDAYLIAADGWKAETRRVIEEIKTGKNKGEKKDKGWTCDLIPKEFIVSRYFKNEQDAIASKQAELDQINGDLEILVEENSSDEGILKDVSTKADAENAVINAIIALWNEDDKNACNKYTSTKQEATELDNKLKELKGNHYLSALRNSKGNLTLKAVKDKLDSSTDRDEKTTLQLFVDSDKLQKVKSKKADELIAAIDVSYKKQLATDPLSERLTDLNIVVTYIQYLGKQSLLKSELKKFEEELDDLAFAKYPELTETEVKSIVLDDKWLPAIEVTVKTEMNRISQQLAGRIKELVDRYEIPLPAIDKQVKELEEKVNAHLTKMGFVWN